jgi:YidC/Oxa1 family membrane protein insertase
MKAMQELSPKMKKIQEKYKDNPQVMQQKIGALYKDAGVNPLAGCLPLLIQMPILMGMYYSLYNFSYPTPESAYFLWMTSMSDPDPLYILPVLSALTTFLQQKMTTTDSNNPQMKMMMFIMPLFIGWISINFPSGLVLYWVTMNVVQIIQQWWMYRGDNAAPKKEAA